MTSRLFQPNHFVVVVVVVVTDDVATKKETNKNKLLAKRPSAEWSISSFVKPAKVDKVESSGLKRKKADTNYSQKDEPKVSSSLKR